MIAKIAHINSFTDDELKNLGDISNYIRIYRPDPNFDSIQINLEGDWIDLRNSEDITLKKGESTLIDLGVAIALPKFFFAMLAPRSSTFKKYNIMQTNSIGIIDHSYCGNDDIWAMPVIAKEDTFIPKGTRICQFTLIPTIETFLNMKEYFNVYSSSQLYIIEVDDLGTNSRGGFGSTGDR